MSDTVPATTDNENPESPGGPPGETSRGVFAAVEPWAVELVGPAAAILYAAFRFRRNLDPEQPVILGDGDWHRWTGLSRTQVSRAKAKLVEAGLVEIDVRKQRGVPMSHWRFGRAVHRAESRDPGSRDIARSSSTQEVEEEVTPRADATARLPLGDEPAATPPEDPIKARARQIVDRVWERSDPKPATPYIGCVKIAEKLLRAGHDPQAIGRAMLEAPTISTGAVEFAINRRTKAAPSRREPIDTNREGPEGRIDL